MEFDFKKDFKIFDPILRKRPELSSDNLKEDLKKYYLPYVEKLIQKKKFQSGELGLIIGVSAIQGAGKTTQGDILEVLLKHLGYSSVSLSLDDHYITHQQLSLLRQRDPRYIRRGVTHDIDLAIRDLNRLQQMGEDLVVLISGYDKGAQAGDGDRFRWVNPTKQVILKARIMQETLTVNKRARKVFALSLESLTYQGKVIMLPSDMGSDIPLAEGFLPENLLTFLHDSQGEEITISQIDQENIKFEAKNFMNVSLGLLPNGWRVVAKKPDFIFYDGWMLGVRKVSDESIFDSGLPALESVSARQFARDINNKLLEYEALWDKLQFMNVLYVPDYQVSLQWRDQAEEVLRAKGSGMSHRDILEFVHYFWRSVHPAIYIKNLARDTLHTQQVVIIDNNHQVKEVLDPQTVAQKYI